MKITSYYFIVLLVLASVSATAQSGNILSQSLTWHSSSGYDLIASDSVEAVMKFTSVNNDRIEHRNHNNVLQTFDIVSTEGSWTNVAAEGSMTYNVSINSATGLIKIERTSSGVFLTVDLSSGGGAKVKYIINQIE